MWGSNWPVYTESARHPWGEEPAEGSQAVSAYPNFTPIILKPKTPPFLSLYVSRFLSLFLSLFPLIRLYVTYVDDIDIETREEPRRKKGNGERMRALSTARRGTWREKRGIWQIATRQNFRASIFHVGRKTKNKRDPASSIFQAVVRNEINPARKRREERSVRLPVRPEIERNRRRFP